jgi:DNA-binding transcriptional MocR family regulator
MKPELRSLIVDGEAQVLRRQLGAAAWAVLETMLAQSCGPAERCVATSTVRSLAADLGVSKDTVARALGRLRAAGIVTAEQPRAVTGTFTTGSYRIAVPACITFVEPSVPPAAAPSPVSRTSRQTVAQHSLFDVDPGTA